MPIRHREGDGEQDKQLDLPHHLPPGRRDRDPHPRPAGNHRHAV